MLNMVLRYLVILAVFLAIDALWLGLVARKLYKEQLGYLMKKDINWVAALVFYMIYVLGIQVFVVNGALEAGSPLNALLYGGLFGFIAYATYDLTNLSTIKDWPIKITVIDLVWGTAVSALTSVTGYFLITVLNLV
jgi:uncharacterized membrane protein